MSTHGWPSAYAGIYSKQLWVYVVVGKRAKATARLPLPVYEKSGQDRQRTDTHPMAKLLRNPNPGMSGFDLWRWTSATFDIYGDTAWLKKRRGGDVVALYPLHPSSLSYDNGKWHFDNGKLRLDDIPEADLVRFVDFHPDSLTRGLSPLEPLRSTLENEWSARSATSSFWRRGARPAMALAHPSILSEGAATRLKTQFDDIAAGADKTGVSVVLEEGMVPKVMTLTAEEAQYIETRKLNREEVCAAYDIPPPVVHILDHATFSNITEQMRSMYRDTMAPHLGGFEAALEVGLRQAEWPDDDIYAEFLMDEVLRGDFETRQDALAKATHMTIAEKRKVENLPFIDGTDRIFLNTATLPLDAIDAQTAAMGAQAPKNAPQDDDQPLARVIPLPVARSVLGRLGWQRNLSEVDASAVTNGLDPRDAEAVTKALDLELAAGGTVADLRSRLSGMGVKMVRVKAPALDDHQASVERTLTTFFARQAAAVLPNGTLRTEVWDEDLAGELHATAVAVSGMIGKAAVREMGFNPSLYDVDRTVEFLKAVTRRLATTINATTKSQLEAAEDPTTVFAKATDSRAKGIAVGVTTRVAGFAVVEAGRRVAESEGVTPTKTWITGQNPRPEHAAMDGQTVPIDETFSDGSDWPGGLPGCNCELEVSF
jgi:HK97 family phage portal protein